MSKSVRKTKSLEYWQDCLSKVKCPAKAVQLVKIFEHELQTHLYYSGQDFIDEQLTNEQWKQNATNVWRFETRKLYAECYDLRFLRKKPFVINWHINYDKEFKKNITHFIPEIETKEETEIFFSDLDNCEFKKKIEYDQHLLNYYKGKILKIYDLLGYINPVIEKEIDNIVLEISKWIEEDKVLFNRYRQKINEQNRCTRKVLFEKELQ